MNLDSMRKELRCLASPTQAALLQRFFKTGPGEYGEGDLFLGLKVPQVRQLVRQSDDLKLTAVRDLLRSPYHEERLLALLILVRRFQRGQPPAKRTIYRFYLRSLRFINNWDLVDCSAPYIVGGWLLDNPDDVLDKLSASPRLWDRRVAVLATLALIRQRNFAATLRLCQRLLRDPHDLMHKACGWMLREVGKLDVAMLRGFLDQHAGRMPRTMLRYAIERLPEPARQSYLAR